MKEYLWHCALLSDGPFCGLAEFVHGFLGLEFVGWLT